MHLSQLYHHHLAVSRKPHPKEVKFKKNKGSDAHVFLNGFHESWSPMQSM